MIAALIAAGIMVVVGVGFILWMRQLRIAAEPLPPKSTPRDTLTPEQKTFFASRPFMLAGIIVAIINAWGLALFGPYASTVGLVVMIVVAVVIMGALSMVAQRVVQKHMEDK